MPKNIAAIICAAGKGVRFGGNNQKAFVNVAGKAAFLHNIDLFAKHDSIKQIILAVSPEDEEMLKVKWGAHLSFQGVKTCYGGDERFETVTKALQLVKDDIDLVRMRGAV